MSHPHGPEEDVAAAWFVDGVIMLSAAGPLSVLSSPKHLYLKGPPPPASRGLESTACGSAWTCGFYSPGRPPV